MEILKKRITDPLEDQSGQLVAYLDALFRRMMVRRGEDSKFEISREEVRALIYLRESGGAIMSSLAGSLDVPLSTATHTVDRLVAKGLVVRTRSEQDRRLVRVEMSEYGKKLQETFRARQREMARSWLEPLSAAEREAFLELFDKITRSAKPVSEPMAEAKRQ
jgi:DNA-binding MarR family transcriptional regulator